MELWSVNLRLQGHDLPVLAADAVHHGHGRWGVEVDYLGAFGWMSEREQAWNEKTASNGKTTSHEQNHHRERSRRPGVFQCYACLETSDLDQTRIKSGGYA